jgi:hypothetical protein
MRNKQATIDALKQAIVRLEEEDKPITIDSETMAFGDYGIVKNSSGAEIGVLCLSGRSFKPLHENHGLLVNLANGCGAFPKGTLVTPVTQEEAFAVARKWVL